MSLPIILVTGEAGSGKDTISNMLVEDLNGICVAQADPMKRFISRVFGFTEQQLWGSSENRNVLDPSFGSELIRCRAMAQLDTPATEEWLLDVLPHTEDEEINKAYRRLAEWAQDMMESAFKDGGITPRKVLQTLGTEWGRSISTNMWVDYATDRAFKLLQGGYSYHHNVGLMPSDNSGYGVVVITDGRFRNEVLGVKRLGGKVIQVKNPANVANEAEKAGIVGHKSEAEQRSIPSWFFDSIFYNDKANGLAICRQQVAYMVNGLFPQTNIQKFGG